MSVAVLNMFEPFSDAVRDHSVVDEIRQGQKDWAVSNGYDFFHLDSFLESCPLKIESSDRLASLNHEKVAKSDYMRLKHACELLESGYDYVVYLDADLLLLPNFDLPIQS